MPLEPKRKIEQLLEAYAKWRREQAGAHLELTPVTRALLQGEVTRKFAKDSPSQTRWQLLAGFWPRFLLAGGLTAALAVAVFLPLQTHLQPVQNERLAKIAPRPTASPASDKLGLAQNRREDNKVARDKQKSNGLTASAPDAVNALARERITAKQLPAPPPQAQPLADGTIQMKDRRVAELPVQNRDMAANVSAPMALAPNNTERQTGTSQAAPTMTLKFQQNATKVSELKAKSPQVLANFTIERSGNNVQVVDQDGSVYKGQITNAPTATAQTMGGMGGGMGGVSDAQNFSFQVSGTNYRLQQKVLFSGSVTQVGTSPDQSNTSTQTRTYGSGGPSLSGGRSGLAQSQFQTPAQSQASAQSQISGRVQIGRTVTNSFPINATQTP